MTARHGEKVVVGMVLDEEFVFLHYSSFEEAFDKWERRKKRVNLKNSLLKFNDQNLFEKGDYDKFAKLPYENKVFFTANRQFKDKPNCVFFKEYELDGFVKDDIKSSKKYFNVKKFLNSMKHHQ